MPPAARRRMRKGRFRRMGVKRTAEGDAVPCTGRMEPPMVLSLSHPRPLLVLVAAAALLIAASPSAHADPSLASVFGDHMVCSKASRSPYGAGPRPARP